MSLNRSKGSGFYPLFFLFLALTAALYVFGIDRFGLFDVDEAIFAQASSEMLQNDNFTNITYNGAPRDHKPPLIYWLQAFSMAEFGVGAWAARLPSAILGVMTILSFFFFLEHLSRNVRFALTATTILALNMSFFVVTQAATADMALNFFSMTITMTLLANMYAKNRSITPLIVAGLLVGGGLLAKGPVVLMVPGVVVLTVLIFRMDQLGYMIKCVNPVIIGLTALIVIAPWVGGIYESRGLDFFKEFIFQHNLARFQDGFGNSQSSSPFYYVWVVLLGMFPWSLLIPGALFWIMPDFIHRLRSNNPASSLPALGLIWFAVVTIFFSFSATKLPHYIVPGFAGAAIFLAGRLEALGKNKLVSLNMVWTVPVVVLFSLVFMLFPWVPSAVQNTGWLAEGLTMLSTHMDFTWPVDDPELVALLSQNVEMSLLPLLMGAVMMSAVLGGIVLMNKGEKSGIALWGCGMWVALMILKLNVVPTVYAFQQGPTTYLAEQLAAEYQETDQVYYLSFHHPSVRFLSHVPFAPVDSAEQILTAYNGQNRVLVVSEEDKSEALIQALPRWTKVEKSCQASYCLTKLSAR